MPPHFIKKKIWIVCESSDTGTDKKFIERLLADHEIEFDHHEIQAKGSVGQVIDYLKTGLIASPEISSKNIDTVLVIVDADENPVNRFNEIHNCFDQSFFSVQSDLTSPTPISPEKVNVGVFLFPDKQNPGSLETLCLNALNDSSCNQKLRCIDSYLDCLKTSNVDVNMTENNISKSKFRIFMATPDPDRYVNSIIDCIDTQASAFQKILDFLKLS
jgi:hypothetical protein